MRLTAEFQPPTQRRCGNGRVPLAPVAFNRRTLSSALVSRTRPKLTKHACRRRVHAARGGTHQRGNVHAWKCQNFSARTVPRGDGTSHVTYRGVSGQRA